MQTGGPSDAVLQQFYTDHQQTNLAKIEETKIHIEQVELIDAIVKNNSISPENLHEQNYKSVHEVYLNSWAQKRFELEETEKTTLKVIAEQNSLEGGRAVFTARVMLDTLVEEQIAVVNPRLGGSNSEEQFVEIVSINDENFITKFYPNPSDGNFQLDYNLNFDAILIIYELGGRQITKYNLSPEENYLRINETQLNGGLYFYEIIMNGESLFKEKLMIIK